MMQTRLFILLPVLASIVCLPPLSGCASQVSDAKVSAVSPEDVASWLEKASDSRLVIDVRNAEHFQTAHIDGAQHFDLPALSESRHSEFFARHKTLVVYGDNAGSARATAAAKRLLSLGYRDVRVLQGGMDAWRSRGFPITE